MWNIQNSILSLTHQIFFWPTLEWGVVQNCQQLILFKKIHWEVTKTNTLTSLQQNFVFDEHKYNLW